MAARGIEEALLEYAVGHAAHARLATLAGAQPVCSPAPGALSRDTLPDDTLPAVSGIRLLAASAPQAQPARGDRVDGHSDHFEITAPIGRGGMGIVYSAWDRALQRRVALKVLPDEVEECPEERERFLGEARAQARLSSPHVVHVYYVGRGRLEGCSGGESSFFAMELVDGGTLEDVLARGERLEPTRARELMLGVASGLRDALAVGIVHRDIKPGNLLLDSSGEVRIADFGVARRLEPRGDLRRTLPGQVVGTPLYMAPEQACGEAVDHRADMYALGCTFYHLLAGLPPFDGSTVSQILRNKLTAKLRPLSEMAPRVPRPLAAVVERLLERDPARRYQSYDALLAALTALAAADRPARVAGVPARGAACVVDVIVAVVLVRLLGWPGLWLHLAAITIAHARFGQTLGKWLMNIEVRAVSGAALSWAHSLGRTLSSLWLPLFVVAMLFLAAGSGELGAALSLIEERDVNAFARMLFALALGNGLLSLVWMAGLVIALFHPRKRAAHDLLASTEVVYRLP